MTAKSNALGRVRSAYDGLAQAAEKADGLRGKFAYACLEAYQAGANDREISEAIDGELSRARIQQLRNLKSVRKITN